MNNTEHLLSKMNMQYQNFSKGQKKLAAYIKENYDKAAFLTAAKLGETVGVSESTVVRFAIYLGYKGYPEFQRAGRTGTEQIKFHTENGDYLWKGAAVRDSGYGAAFRH